MDLVDGHLTCWEDGDEGGEEDGDEGGEDDGDEGGEEVEEENIDIKEEIYKDGICDTGE